MGVFKFLFRNLDHFRGRFFGILAASIVAGVSAFLIPVALSEFTQGTLAFDRVRLLIMTVVGLYIVHLVFQWVVRWFGEALASQFANYLRGKYFRRIQQLSLNKLNQQHSGALLSLTSRVADGMQQILNSLFWDLAPGLATLVLFMYFTALASPLAGGLNALLLTVFVGVGIVLSRRMVPLSAELNLRQAALTEAFVDLTTNMTTVKKLGLTAFANKRLQQQIGRTDEQISRVQKFHANRWLLLHSLYGGAYLGTIGIIVWQVAGGTIALSLLILFIGGYSAIRSLVERLSENIKSFMEMRAYLASLEQAVAGARQRKTGKNRQWQQLTFNDVRFSYNGTVHAVRVPDFSLRPGEHVCVIGPSGQGKSTFLNLLAGFYEPESGVIAVDGKSYDHFGQAFLDTQFATISQETELFDLSLRKRYARGRYS